MGRCLRNILYENRFDAMRSLVPIKQRTYRLISHPLQAKHLQLGLKLRVSLIFTSEYPRQQKSFISIEPSNTGGSSVLRFYLLHESLLQLHLPEDGGLVLPQLVFEFDAGQFLIEQQADLDGFGCVRVQTDPKS